MCFCFVFRLGESNPYYVYSNWVVLYWLIPADPYLMFFSSFELTHVLLFVLFSCFFLTRRNHKRRVPLDDSPPATNYVNARMLHALQVWRIFIQICWHRHFVKVDKVHISRFSTCFFRCWRTAPTSPLAKACYANQCVPNSHT